MGAQGSKDDGDYLPSPDQEATEGGGIVLTGNEDIIQLVPGLSVRLLSLFFFFSFFFFLELTMMVLMGVFVVVLKGRKGTLG